MSRVLVTGSGGFLGRALATGLRREGAEVVEFDNHSRHGSAGERRDVRDASAVLCAAEGVGAVFHLAAINGTASFYSKPWEVAEVQVRGTLNVIDACIRHGIRSLYLFSTSEVYNNPPIVPTPENVPLLVPDISNPRFSYSGSKIASEVLCQHAPIESVVTLRPHNVIGPGMGYQHVVPEMTMRMRREPTNDFTIKGAGSTRAFIHVDDFTSAVIKIWQHTESAQGRVRECYHVGTEEQTSVTSLAGQIARLVGRQFRWRTAPGADGEPRSRCPDTRKLRALGWLPTVALDQAVSDTVACCLAKEDQWPS